MKKSSINVSIVALCQFLGRVKADQKGNVLMILGFAIIPITFAVGFGIDYGRAMTLQTRLNAAADAAALAAVGPNMIFQSNTASRNAASKMFHSQANRLTGFEDLEMTPVVTDATTSSSGALGFLRKATVAYTAQSTNIFGAILGSDTLTISGSATASAAQPPNVDFYLAMDNSPSMLLPATSDGILKIQAATTTTALPKGCAFACHAMLPRTDKINIRDQSGLEILLSTAYYTSGSPTQGVYYRYNTSTLALHDSAGNSMSSTASATAPTTTTYAGTGNNYRRIDTTVTTVTTTKYTVTDSTTGPVTINKVVSTTPSSSVTTTYLNRTPQETSTTNSTGSTSTTTTNFGQGYWADGYWLTQNYGLAYGSPANIVLRKDEVVSAATQLIPFARDQASQYHVTYRMQMFSFDWTRTGQTTPVRQLSTLTDVSTYASNYSVQSIFPADDYWWKNSMPSSSLNIDDKGSEMLNMLTRMNTVIPTAGTGAPGVEPQKIFFLITDGMIDQPNGGGRYFGPLRATELAQCTAIKAKGIKIAILYTQYLPESLAGDSWSQTNIAPFLPAPPSPYPVGGAGNSDQVLTALNSCASPGITGVPLVQTVTANDDITTALQQLFSTALQAAKLVQ